MFSAAQCITQDASHIFGPAERLSASSSIAPAVICPTHTVSLANSARAYPPLHRSGHYTCRICTCLLNLGQAAPCTSQASLYLVQEPDVNGGSFEFHIGEQGIG